SATTGRWAQRCCWDWRPGRWAGAAHEWLVAVAALPAPGVAVGAAGVAAAVAAVAARSPAQLARRGRSAPAAAPGRTCAWPCRLAHGRRRTRIRAGGACAVRPRLAPAGAAALAGPCAAGDRAGAV